MIRCKIVNLLFSLVPINRIRGYLIQNHFLKCPYCAQKLATSSEVKQLLITEDSPEAKTNLWPSLEETLSWPQKKSKQTLLLHYRWRYTAAGALALLASGVFIFYSNWHHNQNNYSAPSESLQIQYIKVHDQPAHTFYYQSPGSDYIFLWAEKISIEGDSL
jgi:hypothetical protein